MRVYMCMCMCTYHARMVYYLLALVYDTAFSKWYIRIYACTAESDARARGSRLLRALTGWLAGWLAGCKGVIDR